MDGQESAIELAATRSTGRPPVLRDCRAVTTQGPADHVPIGVVDAVLARVAAVLHDQPAQSLVAAGLMLESTGSDDPVLIRGLTAVQRANVQVRDVMWALVRTNPSPGRLAEDLGETFERVADPEHGLTVEVDDRVTQVDADRMATLAIAVHDAVIALVDAGATISSIVLGSDDDVLALTATTGQHVEADLSSPWLDLAAARLAPLAGTVTVTAEGVRATVPARSA